MIQNFENNTVFIKGVRGETNRFAVMLQVPDAKHPKRLDIKTLDTLEAINDFVDLWRHEAIKNHCDFVISLEVPYFPERTLPIGYQVAGPSDPFPMEMRASTLQPVSS